MQARTIDNTYTVIASFTTSGTPQTVTIAPSNGMHVQVAGTFSTLQEAQAHQRYVQQALGLPVDAPKPKTVVCEQTGARYDSIAAAARSINADPSTMRRHLLRTRGHHTIKGLTFYYHKDSFEV